MNWADWLIVFVIVISGLIGAKRGFIKEALSLIVWIAAFLAASWFKESIAHLFADWLDAVSMRQLSAFILVFIVVLVLGGVINYLLGFLIEIIGLKTTDHLFGALFGLARGVVVIMIVVLYLPKIVSVHLDAWWYNSVLIPYFSSMEETFFAVASAVYNVIIDLL